MAIVKPFKCVRPDVKLASRVAALPYDVYNRSEAKAEVLKENLSFLKIDRAESQFDDSFDMYDKKVYEKASSMLNEMIDNKTFIEDTDLAYYIYELTMNNRAQSGIVAVSSVDDYLNDVIKKHEKTRADKEIDRINHVDYCSAQTGPIFLAYKKSDVISEVINKTKKNKPLYDFTSNDSITHRVWKISDENDVNTIFEAFKKISSTYIADGHHRAASAVKVALKRREAHKDYTGNEEFNFFLSVLFPDEELMIMDYNRVVKDLNGMTKDEFINKLKENFSVCEVNNKFKPSKKGEFGLFIDSKWYKLVANSNLMVNDPVEGLDVAILQNNVLTPLLGINDPKTDKRIDFVGGIRGLSELERRCNLDMKLAFSMYPTSIDELFSVADANKLMPPKSTWFEPKLRSGLFIHKIER